MSGLRADASNLNFSLSSPPSNREARTDRVACGLLHSQIAGNQRSTSICHPQARGCEVVDSPVQSTLRRHRSLKWSPNGRPCARSTSKLFKLLLVTSLFDSRRIVAPPTSSHTINPGGPDLNRFWNDVSFPVKTTPFKMVTGQWIYN